MCLATKKIIILEQLNNKPELKIVKGCHSLNLTSILVWGAGLIIALIVRYKKARLWHLYLIYNLKREGGVDAVSSQVLSILGSGSLLFHLSNLSITSAIWNGLESRTRYFVLLFVTERLKQIHNILIHCLLCSRDIFDFIQFGCRRLPLRIGIFVFFWKYTSSWDRNLVQFG